jgi:hypothetical protein
MLVDKALKSYKHKLAAFVGHAHGAFEAQELLNVPRQFRRCDDRRHAGNGRETSRNVSAAILT